MSEHCLCQPYHFEVLFCFAPLQNQIVWCIGTYYLLVLKYAFLTRINVFLSESKEKY